MKIFFYLFRFCLQRFGIDNVAEINAAGVRIAKEVGCFYSRVAQQPCSVSFKQAASECGKGTIVAGAVGPTGEGSGFIDEDKCAEIADAFRTQLTALVSTPAASRLKPHVLPRYAGTARLSRRRDARVSVSAGEGGRGRGGARDFPVPGRDSHRHGCEGPHRMPAASGRQAVRAAAS